MEWIEGLIESQLMCGGHEEEIIKDLNTIIKYLSEGRCTDDCARLEDDVYSLESAIEYCDENHHEADHCDYTAEHVRDLELTIEEQKDLIKELKDDNGK